MIYFCLNYIFIPLFNRTNLFKPMKVLSVASCIEIFLLLILISPQFVTSQDVFPDGTTIPDWFKQVEETDISKLGKQYVITDFDVKMDSTLVQT